MKPNNYELQIASSQDREKVYCEIYYKGQIIDEISQEQNKLLLEIYSYPINEQWLQFNLEEFQKKLELGKNIKLKKINLFNKFLILSVQRLKLKIILK